MYSARTHYNLLQEKNEKTDTFTLLGFCGVVGIFLVGQQYELGFLGVIADIFAGPELTLNPYIAALFLIWFSFLQLSLINFGLAFERLRRYERVHRIENVESTRLELLSKIDQYS